jgi:hypothetical protein
MADNSALHAQLEALDHELEEGDITRKGYEKRRTMILSQYLGPQEVERLNTGLRVHSADDSSHPGSEIANNAAAAAAVLGEGAGTGAGGGGYVAYPQDLDGDAASSHGACVLRRRGRARTVRLAPARDLEALVATMARLRIR